MPIEVRYDTLSPLFQGLLAIQAGRNSAQADAYDRDARTNQAMLAQGMDVGDRLTGPLIQGQRDKQLAKYAMDRDAAEWKARIEANRKEIEDRAKQEAYNKAFEYTLTPQQEAMWAKLNNDQSEFDEQYQQGQIDAATYEQAKQTIQQRRDTIKPMQVPRKKPVYPEGEGIGDLFTREVNGIPTTVTRNRYGEIEPFKTDQPKAAAATGIKPEQKYKMLNEEISFLSADPKFAAMNPDQQTAIAEASLNRKLARLGAGGNDFKQMQDEGIVAPDDGRMPWDETPTQLPQNPPAADPVQAFTQRYQQLPPQNKAAADKIMSEVDQIIERYPDPRSMPAAVRTRYHELQRALMELMR